MSNKIVLTEKDVGKKFRLRNGDIVKAFEWDQVTPPRNYPLGCDNWMYYSVGGKGCYATSAQLDIVARIEEPNSPDVEASKVTILDTLTPSELAAIAILSLDKGDTGKARHFLSLIKEGK